MAPSLGSDFVHFFRSSSPYIHSHRGKVFVVAFGGDVVEADSFSNLISDFALLNGLGIRLVLVHGIRPQVERCLTEKGIEQAYHQGLRVTDEAALECVKESAGSVRLEIEALLSCGLANSPMAGLRIRVSSGNFVIAKPLGVRFGIDFRHTGEVRRVDAEGIAESLHRGDIVVLSPVGYSPTGEVFNLGLEEVATSVAVALRADKLILLRDGDCELGGQKLRQLTAREAATYRDAGSVEASALAAAIACCEAGVPRVHLLNWRVNGVLLWELFTRDGIGALISSTPFEDLRPAGLDDIGGILDLIEPLETQGVLAPRSRERIEAEIDRFSVLDRDGFILGCVAVHPYIEEAMSEIACLVLHEDYRGEGRGERLLTHAEGVARTLGSRQAFALTTHTQHWFREHGYFVASRDALPEARQAAYSRDRNSLVLIKPLDRP